MGRIQSQFGSVEVFEDFLVPQNDETWVAGGFNLGNVSITSVNEGTVQYTVDEPNGVVAFTTDTADNDNVALYAGVFSPAEGPLVMEARFKQNDITLGAIFCGFSQTLAIDTPVMPGEYATTTLTYNGTGSMSGMLWDPDGTANDWRSVFGDAGAKASGSATGGTVANSGDAKDAVNDVYDIVRVEVDPSGTSRSYLNGVLIEEVVGAYATTTDNLHAVLMLENRSAAARVLEVDYFYACANRDWADGS